MRTLLNPLKSDKPLFYILKITLACIVYVLSFFSLQIFDKAKEAISNYNEAANTKLIIGNHVITIEISDDDNERTKGLSGREGLDQDHGMLFVFDELDYHGIWMKDMNFPIDIIWFNENNQINYILENISPDTYPRIFKPSEKAKYVLETQSGFVKENGLKIGDELNLLRFR